MVTQEAGESKSELCRHQYNGSSIQRGNRSPNLCPLKRNFANFERTFKRTKKHKLVFQILSKSALYIDVFSILSVSTKSRVHYTYDTIWPHFKCVSFNSSFYSLITLFKPKLKLLQYSPVLNNGLVVLIVLQGIFKKVVYVVSCSSKAKRSCFL